MMTRRGKILKRKLKEENDVHPNEQKQTKLNNRSKVPDVLYTDDGTVFYPCKTCCRAFAKKVDLKKHLDICLSPISYQQVSENLQQLPLSSVENTMNGQKPTSATSELNNNQNQNNHGTDSVTLDTEMFETKFAISEQRIKDDMIEQKFIAIDPIPNGINQFDLKTKAKITKVLNSVLENNGFNVRVMGNGDVVTKMYATDDFPQLDFVTRLHTDKENSNEQIHIALKHSIDNNYCDLPSIPKILEKVFGPDEVFTNLMHDCPDTSFIECESQASEEVIMHIDEEHFPTDDQVLSMADEDGTIVLEDLDIHICKQCGAVYHTLEDLVTHDKYDHRKFKKKFSLDELEKYAVLFKKSKNKECPICMKKLKGNGSWARHAQSHSDVGMYECKVCHKRFTRDDHRKNHEARHLQTV